jgi:hypothetical protein
VGGFRQAGSKPHSQDGFGLIDEVPGSPSLTHRKILENVKGRMIEKISVHDFDRFVDYDLFGYLNKRKFENQETVPGGSS